MTDLDLVEWQLRIAAGERLPIVDQAEIRGQGHAFEARIYAENPDRNFLPATGTVWHHVPPAEPNTGVNSEGVRVDTGIQIGQEVGVYYDPMICKLIVHDENRDKALQKLTKALKSYQIAGVPTNLNFLIACAQHKAFQKAGDINTGFLDYHLEEVLARASTSSEGSSILSTIVGIFATLLHMEHRIGIPGADLTAARRAQSPWSSLSGSWRMGYKAKRSFILEDGRVVDCTCLRDGSYEISVDGSTPVHIDGCFAENAGSKYMQVVVGHSKRIKIATAFQEVRGHFHVRMWPTAGHEDYFWQVEVRNPVVSSSLAGASPGVVGQGTVKAPMPGKVSRILVAEGDRVTEGDVLVVMEAMKMEHRIVAPASGVLESLHCRVDEVVQDGALLAVIEEEASEGDMSLGAV